MDLKNSVRHGRFSIADFAQSRASSIFRRSIGLGMSGGKPVCMAAPPQMICQQASQVPRSPVLVHWPGLKSQYPRTPFLGTYSRVAAGRLCEEEQYASLGRASGVQVCPSGRSKRKFPVKQRSVETKEIFQ